MDIAFEPVTTPVQIGELAVMAEQIWSEYWPALIGPAQTRYMIDKFQSASAIERDMGECGYRYWFLVNPDGKRVGYTGGAAEIMTGDAQIDGRILHNAVIQDRYERRFFISKIYLLASERGKHYASQVIRFYDELCACEGLQAMYLTVNKGNELGIRAYQGNGFDIVDKQVADIGGGFVMDDYVMAREVSSRW